MDLDPPPRIIFYFGMDILQQKIIVRHRHSLKVHRLAHLIPLRSTGIILSSASYVSLLGKKITVSKPMHSAPWPPAFYVFTEEMMKNMKIA